MVQPIRNEETRNVVGGVLKLAGGPHVAVVGEMLLGADLRTAATMQAAADLFRHSVPTAADLRGVLPVVYFSDERQGARGHHMTPSGHLVRDVLEGKSDWPSEHVEQFRAWVASHDGLNSWLEAHLDEVWMATRRSSTWLESTRDPGAA